MSANCQSRPAAVLPKTLVILLVMLLAGCGVTTGTTGITNGGPLAGLATGTSTVTATASVSGTSTPTEAGTYNTATGCPQATQVVQWPSPPALIVTSANASKGVTVHVGQSLEVALPFGQRRSLGLSAGSPELLLNTPAGYGDASLKSCVWRFTAEQVGQATLNFTFAPICQAHMECPQFIGLTKISIDVVES
jgi:hypothetical protein